MAGPCFTWRRRLRCIARGIAAMRPAGRAQGARVMVEKPFGTDLQSAQELNATMHAVFPEDSVYRVDNWLGLDPLNNVQIARLANSVFEPLLDVPMSRAPDHDGRGVRRRRPGRFYDRTAAVRDVVQNHMLQVLATVTADPPDGGGLDTWVTRSPAWWTPCGRWPRMAASRVSTGVSTRGYQDVPGVERGSGTESSVRRPTVSSPARAARPPILIRLGKIMPVPPPRFRCGFGAPSR
jgi:glucose-6-phosphate 1-dehydrogenase